MIPTAIESDDETISICRKCKIGFPATTKYFYLRKDSNRYRRECKKCTDKTNKKWAEENREKLNAYHRKRRRENPERYKAITKKSRHKHRHKRNRAAVKWQKDNPEKSNAIQKRSYTKRRSTPKGNLEHRMSVAIQAALKGNKNSRKWESLVGYTLIDLKRHFEKQFKKGMDWDKFLKGEIHIDHKIPKSVFNYTKPEHEDFKRCWALENLQPLWAKENMSKNSSLDKPFQPSLKI